mmetsp:Transcript_27745/g.91225  ORF Transcript_27745/g.91225 Transcript_27745/m.91225 type:complete len:264 (+) Transcript_27745:799-1590(+)
MHVGEQLRRPLHRRACRARHLPVGELLRESGGGGVEAVEAVLRRAARERGEVLLHEPPRVARERVAQHVLAVRDQLLVLQQVARRLAKCLGRGDGVGARLVQRVEGARQPLVGKQRLLLLHQRRLPVGDLCNVGSRGGPRGHNDPLGGELFALGEDGGSSVGAFAGESDARRDRLLVFRDDGHEFFVLFLALLKQAAPLLVQPGSRPFEQRRRLLDEAGGGRARGERLDLLLVEVLVDSYFVEHSLDERHARLWVVGASRIVV